MSRNFYSEINLHVVWHTKNSLPLLTPAIESVIYGDLKKRIIETPGVFIHEIGGIETHVHLAITIPPTLLISEFIGRLKGGSSHVVNHRDRGNSKELQWQTGYGVLSFGTRDLPWVAEYVRNQRTHHAQHSVHDRLERITHDDDGVATTAITACG